MTSRLSSTTAFPIRSLLDRIRTAFPDAVVSNDDGERHARVAIGRLREMGHEEIANLDERGVEHVWLVVLRRDEKAWISMLFWPSWEDTTLARNPIIVQESDVYSDACADLVEQLARVIEHEIEDE